MKIRTIYIDPPRGAKCRVIEVMQLGKKGKPAYWALDVDGKKDNDLLFDSMSALAKRIGVSPSSLPSLSEIKADLAREKWVDA